MNLEEFESDKLEGVPHPRFSSRVIGQEKVKNQFFQAYGQQRMHHAWLMCGPSGIGKATLAWQLAKFLLTRNLSGMLGGSEININFDDPVVSRIEALSEPHLKLIRKNFDTKTKKIKAEITIDNIRELVEFFEFTSPDGKPRIAIIDSIDELNVNASNALLKVLEEPPYNSYFFLVSHSPESLLPTVRSRCLAAQCENLSADDQLYLLNEFGFISDDQVKKVVSVSRGSVGEAIRIINQDGLKLYASIVGIYKDLPRIEVSKILEIASKTEGAGKQELTQTINKLTIHFVSRLVKAGAVGKISSEIFSGENIILNKLSPNFEKSHEWAMLYSRMITKAKDYQESNIDGYSQVFENLINIKKIATL